MESATPKRQRMMMMSYVSPRLRPDVPATFESLNEDTKRLILKFVGNKSYVTYAGINKHCKEIYLNTEGMTKETFLFGYGLLSVITGRYDDDPSCSIEVSEGVVLYNRLDVLDWAFQEYDEDLLRGICVVAAEEGRTDILNKAWNDIEDDGHVKDGIFESVHRAAASHGKVNVLKWLEAKGFVSSKDKETYAREAARHAARHGQLHLLEWLIDEKGLQLSEGLYDDAVRNDQLHVLKWLREKEVDWGESTFRNAACRGNMNVLQWLHDEGCPWPGYCSVYEQFLWPEGIDWLRSNGYGSRILL